MNAHAYYSRILTLSRCCLLVAFLLEGCAPAAQSARPEAVEPYPASAAPAYAPVQLGPSLLEQLDAARCLNTSDLLGKGIGVSEGAALAQAQAEIALQIQAEIQALRESRKVSERSGKSERLTASWSSDVRQVSRLANAQAARAVFSARANGQSGVVACMSRADAARPFLDRQGLMLDSFALAVDTERKQGHPLRKNEAWQAAQNLYGRMQPLAVVIEGLGMQDATQDAERESLYDKLQEDFRTFRSSYGFYWEPAQGEVAEAVLGKLSGRYRIETGGCSQGLRLELEAEAPRCNQGSFGISCMVKPMLAGRSCNGETYFNLPGGEVRGVGKYDEAEARSRMLAQLSAAPFWSQWTDELDRWRLE